MLGNACGHVSERRLLTGGFLLAGGATAAVSLCTTPFGMAACASVAGFSASCVNPLLALFIADLFPPEVRASVVGLWQTSAQAGGIAANNAAGAMLAASGNSWRAVFRGSGLVVAAFAPVVYVAVQPALSEAAATAAAAKTAALAAASPAPESATEAKGRAPLESTTHKLEPITERIQGARLQTQASTRVVALLSTLCFACLDYLRAWLHVLVRVCVFVASRQPPLGAGGAQAARRGLGVPLVLASQNDAVHAHELAAHLLRNQGAVCCEAPPTASMYSSLICLNFEGASHAGAKLDTPARS